MKNALLLVFFESNQVFLPKILAADGAFNKELPGFARSKIIFFIFHLRILAQERR